jgi:hypothetical protein
MSRAYNLRSSGTMQKPNSVKRKRPLLDPMTGLDTSIPYNEDAVSSRAAEIVADFVARGIDPKKDAAVPFILRARQNCYLILLDEEKGYHLSKDFYNREASCTRTFVHHVLTFTTVLECLAPSVS